MSETSKLKKIATIAICTVSLGFGGLGITLFSANFNFGNSSQDDTEVSQSTTPSPSPTETPTNTPTQEPQNSSQSNSTEKIIEKIIIKTEVVKTEGKVLTPIANNNSNEEDNQSSDAEEADTNNNSENSKAKYEISIDSPGQIVALSDDDIKNGFINISNKDDTKTVSGQSIISCDSNELINSSTNSQEVNYMNVTPGVYIIETNINIDNVNFYFINNINEMISSSEKADDEFEDITIPTEEEKEIVISEEKPSKFFKVTTEESFPPVFKFYTENELDPATEISLKILDKDKNELQSISINETNESDTNEIDGIFSFTKDENYYIEISSKNIGEISQVCYLQIYELENSY